MNSLSLPVQFAEDTVNDKECLTAKEIVELEKFFSAEAALYPEGLDEL